ncbi:MAG: bifunctional (p)ppGpp synthetase/guanosine-3',5'-bis(diphosphate) 3'-pyrophosphohydrolase [Ruminococcaceae bacterium]|nr:bifunctional (p)ppGpp synthetase/guanosine-3',5'-bis(diphosphate) 3'-pyrophosphohydrolase [Oscillospiraceae bacterium]
MNDTCQTLYEELIKKIKQYNPNCDFDLIERAYLLAANAHKEQKRVSGRPYLAHPLSVAQTVAEMELDVASICAALLHDVVEDTECTIEDIREQFGEEIAILVDGVTKLDKIQFSSKEERDMENLRKMFLAMAKDIRVIIIKFADRLHNMATLISMPEEKQREKARETLSIFAPLAHRLGMYKIKWELEDTSLKYIDPIAFYEIVEGIKQKRQEREDYIIHIKAALKDKLDVLGIDCTIDGRPKHFYSIYRKMFTQNKTLDQIYDLFAVRIITNTVSDCYAALGAAHELYKPMPGRFKDYIAMPKPNMYQSLHTTVIGPGGRPFEIQIRTKEMHAVAENGIAAHWKYKEGNVATDQNMEQKLSWVRQLLELQRDAKDEEEFLSALRIDLFTDQVFVFTPKGDVQSFPAGATPIDFAFSIHSAIGCKMQGARVNGKIVPLDYQMQNGDIVEIITSSSIHGPSPDWLKIVKTGQARNKINQWFKKENREQNIEKGKDMLEKEIKRQGMNGLGLLKNEYLEPLCRRYGFKSIDDLYSGLGFGGIPLSKVISRLKDEYKKSHQEEPDPASIIASVSQAAQSKPSSSSSGSDGVTIAGVDNCLIRFSKCCNPVPGDRIIGYITRGRGVSIHRQDCSNIASAYSNEEEKVRLIEVAWEDNKNTSYLSTLKVVSHDRSGILVEFTNAIADSKVPLKGLNARTTKDDLAIIELTLEITGTEQLDRIIKKLRAISGVIDVTRS